MYILWEDSQRRERVTYAKLLDLSVTGAKLLVDEVIPVRSYVSCNDQTLGVHGTASVRYCIFTKGKYEVGLEFGSGNGWREPEGRPEDC
jgi:hypothetical protein